MVPGVFAAAQLSAVSCINPALVASRQREKERERERMRGIRIEKEEINKETK